MKHTHWVFPVAVACLLSFGCDNKSTSKGAAGQASASPSAQASAAIVTPPADATKTASGVAFKITRPGQGELRAKDTDMVHIDYVTWGADGKELSSSKERGRPARIGLSGVIPGLAEMLQQMALGEQRRVWIPASQASKGWPNPPQGQAITMDVTLVEVKPGPKKIPVPEDVAAAPEDAKKTKSGLAWKVLKPGTGKVHPKATDTVKVHYSGWTTDGTMFDSSEAREEPTSFPLKGVIEGWTEGVQLMVEGEKARFWIPVELAYKNMPGKPAGMLVFDIELLKILKPPVAPKDVAKPPADAIKTASGLASKVLVKGTGKEHPKATSRVKVDYTGWTTDGKMFDSSITRGQPASFVLSQVIAGWTEGLQLMVVGEQRRFWIPQDLAYKGQSGAPKGMLVFDVELLGFEP